MKNRMISEWENMDTDRILVIDIGNTTIAFTVLRTTREKIPADAEKAAPPESGEAKTAGEEPEICFTAKLPTETGKDLPGFLAAARNLLREYLPEENTGCRAFSLAAVSSVVPACTPAAAAFAREVCSAPPVVVGVLCDTGLDFDGMPEPMRIGADRIADAAWAAARYPLPAVTVDLGTATTGNVIGRNTDECMLSAAVVGTAAMIEGLAGRVEEQLNSPVTLILTGGNAPLVSPWIRRPFHYEPALAAKGAAVIAMREMLRSKNLL